MYSYIINIHFRPDNGIRVADDYSVSVIYQLNKSDLSQNSKTYNLLLVFKIDFSLVIKCYKNNNIKK